jgi:hypothetical protein
MAKKKKELHSNQDIIRSSSAKKSKKIDELQRNVLKQLEALTLSHDNHISYLGNFTQDTVLKFNSKYG